MSTKISQHCPTRNGSQRRVSFGERHQIPALVISHPIFPATENNANPFKRQPSHRCVVPLAPLPLLSIVTSRPLRVGNRMTGPFVKTLPHKLRTSPAKMYPLLFPASFHHWRDPTVGLYFLGAGVTFPLGPKRCQQAWCQHCSRCGERFKDEKIGMRCRRLLIPLCIDRADYRSRTTRASHRDHNSVG